MLNADGNNPVQRKTDAAGVASLSRGGGTQCTSEGVGVYKAAAQIAHALEHVEAQYVDGLGGQSMWKISSDCFCCQSEIGNKVFR